MTIKIYSRTGPLQQPDNLVLLGQADVEPGSNADATITLSTTELSGGAATVRLGTNQEFSGIATINTALLDPTNPVAGDAVLYVGNPPDAPLNPERSGIAGVLAAEPPWVNLAAEVGEPRAMTTDTGMQPLEPGEVVHPGVGIGSGDSFRRVGPGVAQRKTVLGMDFNQDGLDDFCTIGANNAAGAPTVINITFGASHFLTGGEDATKSSATRGDWASPVSSFDPQVGTAIQLPTNAAAERIVAIGSGDFNHDGNPDLVALSNNAAANAPSHVYVLLLTGGPDPADGASLRIYTTRGTQNAATGEGLYGDVAVADFTGDGIDDLAVSAPGEDVGGVSDDEGTVYILFGQPSVLPTNNLPVSGPLWAAAAGSAGVTLLGTPGSNEFFGASLGVGNFDGGNTDLWVATAAEGTTTGGLFLFPGMAGALSTEPAIQYTYVAPTDMLANGLPGDIVCGRFTDDPSGFDDVVVGLPGENAVRVIPPGVNSTGSIMRAGIVGIVNTRTMSTGFLGHALFLGDIGGDGNVDLIVGNYGTGDVYVMYGPISTNGPAPRFSDIRNSFDMALLSDQDTGQAVGVADMNGDGIADLWFADPSADMQCLTGLQPPP